MQGTIRPYDFRNFTEIEKMFKAQVKAKMSVDMDGYDNTKNTDVFSASVLYMF